MALKLAIAGANGRMGRMLAEAAQSDPEVNVFAVFDRDDDAHAALNGAAVLIDFTRPEATIAYLALCEKHRVNMVIGTTGFSAGQVELIHQAAEKIAVVLAPNMSLGVNVTAKLVAMAASSLGMDADIEIFEAHHKMKVDAPSGTALMLGGVAAAARGQSLDAVAVYDRHGKNDARAPSTIIQGEASSIFEELISSGKVDQIADAKQASGLKAAGELSAKDYLKAMRVRSLLQVAFREFFYELDMVLAPTRMGVASGIEVALDAPRAAVPTDRKRRMSGHVPAGNLAGLPALSMPCGMVGGLPIGVTLMGRAFTENALLAVGQQFQQKTDWHKKRPAV